MHIFSSRGLAVAALLLILALGAACGGGTAAPGAHQGAGGSPALEHSAPLLDAGTLAAGAAWPSALPLDQAQPWDGARGASALGTALFVPGNDRFLEGGLVQSQGSASRVLSGDAGAGGLGFALYRIPLAGQPGALGVDVNLRAQSNGAASSYYLGLSDYATGRWEWHGPFSDHHVILGRGAGQLAAADYRSPLGNLFAAVLAYDGSSLDILGLGVEVVDGADTQAPPPVTGLTLEPVQGGLMLQWNSVIDGSLAGYRVYYARQSFDDVARADVRSLPQLEGTTRCFLPLASGPAYVRVAAVDLSGNAGAPSAQADAEVPGGTAPALLVGASLIEVHRAAPAQVSVDGPAGLLYDFDLDGDGVFDVTGMDGAPQAIDTGRPGIIRPRVRASGDGGLLQALGGVSLLVASNSAPVAVASATPASGLAPLTVDFTGTDSADFDGTVVGGGWDFDGDGIFDVWEDADLEYVVAASHEYTAPGLYNARLKVVDDQGAWDVDTVSVYVAGAPGNLPPRIARINASPSTVQTGGSVDFSFNATDDDGSINAVAWDFENDGSTDSSASAPSHAYTAAGLYNVRLTVADDDGATASGYVAVLVQDAPVDLPPVAQLTADFNSTLLGRSSASITPTLDASASYDPEGGALEYAFDLEGDGSFSSFFASPTAPVSLNTPGIYLSAVRVRDPGGNVSTAVCLVAVRRFNPTVLETGVNLDGTTALTALQGSFTRRLGLAYYDSTNDDLRFMASTDQIGASWIPSYVVDANGGEWISLMQGVAQFNMAYYRDGDLFFKASQNDGTSFNVNGTIDNSADDAGDFVSTAFANSNPAAAYYNTTDGDLYFCRASNISGTTWGAPVAVDGTGNTGQYCSLVIIGNAPAIAYYRADTGNLMYVRATTSSGTTWGAPVVVDSDVDDVGKFATMAVVNGNPLIAYFNDTANAVQVCRADDSLGTSWGAPVVAANVDAKSLALLELTNGAFLSVGTTSSVARFMLSTDEDGTAWGALVEIEANGAGERMSATKLTSGLPAVAYFDTNQELHFAAPRQE